MKEKLLASLEMVLKNLKEQKIGYDWSGHGTCNLGLVASCLLGKSPHELQNDFDILSHGMGRDSADWKEAVSYYCPLTGLSSTMIFRRLQIAGLNREDMINLEYLSDPLVLKRILECTPFWKKWFILLGGPSPFINKHYYKEEENLIVYLEAWIELIKEENFAQNVDGILKHIEQGQQV